MRALFVCWRPYQVFNAINFVSNNVEGTAGNSDLFISNIPRVKELYENLKKVELFKHIGIYNGLESMDYLTKMKRHMQAPLTVFSKWAIKHYTILGYENMMEYDLIISSGYQDFLVRMVNSNPNARVIFIEDGTGHYVNHEKKIYQESKAQRILKEFFGKGILMVNPQKFFVYQPSLIDNVNNDFFCQMPSLEKAFSNITTVFGRECQILPPGKKYLYLYNDFCFISMNRKVIHIDEEKTNKVLLKHKKEILVRPHPVIERGPADLEIDNRKYMWEVSAKNLTSDDTLISVNSTACFTPFLLYSATPRIVLLYRLNDNPEAVFSKGFDSFVERFKNVYPGEILIPNNFNEFEKGL